MGKLSKKTSIRAIKSLLFNFMSKSDFLANRFSIFNQAIHYNNVEGKEIFVKKDVFIAKYIEKEILFSGKTGCSLFYSKNKYKVIFWAEGNQSGKNILGRNLVKPHLFKRKEIELNKNITINLLGLHKGSKHYFHFFYDYIFPLLHFLLNAYQNEKISILVRDNQTIAQQETYKMLQHNFPNLEFIPVKKGAFVKSQKYIHIHYTHNNFYNYETNPAIRNSFKKFRDLFVDFYKIKELEESQKKLIYISRNRARLRRLINEYSLIKILKSKGFSIIAAEKLSFRQQIETFLNAKFILGVHGAGFTNLIFGSDQLKFLEIYTKNYGSLDYERTANIKDIKRYFYRENNEYMWQWFYLRIKTFIPKLNKILTENNL
jgi:hypothetical protein